MSRCAFYVLAVAVAIGLGSTVRGDIIMSLSSSTDLTNLTVGDQAEIDVTLSGLPDGHFIFNLDTRVLFPSSQFELVSGPTPSKAFGSVFFGPDNIADPQLANFNANSGPIAGGGGVIGDFPDETANGVGAIGQNGLYYSFIVKAIAVGSGSIGFDLSNPDFNRFSGTDSNPPFAFSPLPTGPDLSFTINAIPEPSSLLLAATAGVVLGGFSWRRRRLA